MSNVHPILPRLTVNANFIGEFISARAPCFALVLVEERKQQQGFLALRTSQPIPANVTGGGFRFGHTLLDNDEFSVIQFVLEFYDFATFNVLVNPKNTIVRTVLSRMVTSGEYTFFAIDLNGTSTAFQSGLEQANRVGLRTNFPVIESATTTSVQGDRAVEWFDRAPTPPGMRLDWVCRDNLDYLDLSHNRLELTPREIQHTPDSHWLNATASFTIHDRPFPPARSLSTRQSLTAVSST